MNHPNDKQISFVTILSSEVPSSDSCDWTTTESTEFTELIRVHNELYSQ